MSLQIPSVRSGENEVLPSFDESSREFFSGEDRVLESMPTSPAREVQ